MSYDDNDLFQDFPETPDNPASNLNAEQIAEIVYTRLRNEEQSKGIGKKALKKIMRKEIKKAFKKGKKGKSGGKKKGKKSKKKHKNDKRKHNDESFVRELIRDNFPQLASIANSYLESKWYADCDVPHLKNHYIHNRLSPNKKRGDKK